MVLKLCVLVGVCLFYSFGLFFFSRGFLLTRHSIFIRSSCDDVHLRHSNKERHVCWVPPTFRRAVFLLIDALRYDFLATDSSLNNSFHHGRLKIVEQILRTQPRNSLLLKFTADPPTTTLQRLKGLTTGSLPTFIDAGSNFAGTNIEEDNIIDQINARGGKVTFMGDDTWSSLFPGKFHREFPFPSFDVKDLHTVDNGVLAHLHQEMDTKEWDLLIGHFLGVDHCGHKYGPNHPEMTKKLDQMNHVIRGVIEKLDDDTVLFVFGDHGMTQTGDHGGDSPDELNAGLFVYSPSHLHRNSSNVGGSVTQVDLVPTFSLLLDLPIPFSNLGAVIGTLFPDESQLKTALEANTWQIVRYAENYLKHLKDSSLVGKLESVLKDFHSSHDKEMVPKEYLRIVLTIHDIFEQSWARFHPEWMLIGAFTVLENFLWSLLLLRGQLIGKRLFLKAITLVLMTMATVGESETVPPAVGILVCLQVAWNLYGLANDLIMRQPVNKLSPSVFPSIVVFGGALCVFSNSFVVHEDSVVRFLLATLLAMTLSDCVKTSSVSMLSRRLGANPKFWTVFPSVVNLKSVGLTATAVVCVRLGALFNRCREEQGLECAPSIFTLPFASLHDDSFWKSFRFFLSVISVLCVNGGYYWFLSRNGHLDGYSGTSVLLQSGMLFSMLGTVGLWTTKWLPEVFVKRYSTQTDVVLPLMVYIPFTLFLASFLWDPLLVFFAPKKEDVSQINPWPNGMVDRKQIYRHVRNNWAEYLGKGPSSDTILGFGLATAYSGSIVAFLLMTSLVILILLGDGIAPSFLLLFGGLFATLETCRQRQKGGRENHCVLPLWTLFAVHSFYAFGHHATFSSIPWDAAFVGLPGNFRFQWVQASLVLFNVNGGQVLLGLCLPLAVVWGRGWWGKRGEVSFHETSPGDVVWQSSLHYISLLALRMLAVTFASAFHKRHLMVWKVFAPNFIFQGVSFILSLVSVLCGYVVFLRVNSALTRLLKGKCIDNPS